MYFHIVFGVISSMQGVHTHHLVWRISDLVTECPGHGVGRSTGEGSWWLLFNQEGRWSAAFSKEVTHLESTPVIIESRVSHLLQWVHQTPWERPWKPKIFWKVGPNILWDFQNLFTVIRGKPCQPVHGPGLQIKNTIWISLQAEIPIQTAGFIFMMSPKRRGFPGGSDGKNKEIPTVQCWLIYERNSVKANDYRKE